MDTECLLAYKIGKGLSFSLEEELFIQKKFEKINLKKGTPLLLKGEPIVDQYYVCEGCLRSYFIDNQGKEHTMQFAIKDWWISDYTAFFTEEKAIMNIESIQDSIVYKISRVELEDLFSALPKMGILSRKKMEKSFARFQKRILANLSQTAKERYISFINTYPNIEQNVKNYHIASYLGITTESLSRIRKELVCQ